MGIHDIPADVRDSLGVDPEACRTGTVDIPRPLDQPSLAAPKDVFALVASLVMGTATTPATRRYELAVPHDAEAGFRTEVHEGDVVRVFDPGGRSLRARVIGAGPNVACHVDGATAAAHVPVGAAMMVSLPTGECQVLEAASETEWSLSWLLPAPPSAPAFGPSPVAAWVGETADRWLAAWAAERTVHGGG